MYKKSTQEEERRAFEPIYGHFAADVSVFIANIFMCGFALECIIRAHADDESCAFPLYTFIAIQLGFVLMLQFAVPIADYLSVGTKLERQPPGVVGTLFLLQLIWLVLGLMWYTSDSDCEDSAPYLNYGSKWLVLVYVGVIPFEFFWWSRMVCLHLSRPDEKKRRLQI